MIRLILVVLVMIAVVAATVFLTLNPGSASIEFLGVSYQMPFVLAAGLLILLTFILLVIWRLVLAAWIAPDQWRRFRSRRRKEQGFDALERALIASAAGDGETAVRQAARADALLDRPALSRLLAARAAEAAGNLPAAEAHYEALLEDPRTRIVADRGLAQIAHERGDHDATSKHASDAFKSVKTVRWAFDALFDSQVAQGRWEEALQTLAEGEKRRHVAPDFAKRRRAVLLTAAALDRETADADRARELAGAAMKAAPDFAPAAVLASRLEMRARKHRKANDTLETAWAAAPHPALAHAYRDLRKSDTRAKRLERLRDLAAIRPEHRESKLLLIEAALESSESETARRLLEPMLALAAPSARLCALAARLARLEGEDEKARRWMTRASHAPGEADWSDIDPEGKPFAYSREDWARMVYVFGDEGRLIHPRYERFELAAGAVPETALLDAPKPRPTVVSADPAPASRKTPRRRASAEPARQPDDPGVEDED